MSPIYYSNWKTEEELPMATALRACGVKLIKLTTTTTAMGGFFAIVHDGRIRKALVDAKEVPKCLEDNSIILIASTEGVMMAPDTVTDSDGRRCHVFGIGRRPRRVSNEVTFLTEQEWKDVIQWAAEPRHRESVEALREAAPASIRELLWPQEFLGLVALAVLCQGYLCTCLSTLGKGKVPNEVVRVVKAMGASACDRPANPERWAMVQTKEWWQRNLASASASFETDAIGSIDAVIDGVMAAIGPEEDEVRRLLDALRGSIVDKPVVVAKAYLQLVRWTR